MGFAGPVKSVVTTRQTFMQVPIQRSGPVIVYPALCDECEFDINGSAAVSRFGGTVQRKILDGMGRAQEQTSEDEKGEVFAHSVFTYGPMGIVRSETYQGGKLSSVAAFTYDGRGNVVESNLYGPDGTLQRRTLDKFDEQHRNLESVAEGPGDSYTDVVRTYSKDTGYLESMTSLNRDGTVRSALRVDESQVLSYWHQPGDTHGGRTSICFADDGGTERDCREYNADGTYTTAHFSFTDPSKRHPVQVKLYGSDLQLVMEADYDYELDSFGNWAKRTVWVRTEPSGERHIVEKDARTLTYYPAEAANTSR